MIAYPITQPVQVWRYMDFANPPPWVSRCCFLKGTDLIHERQSGRQIVNPGEYLVRELDGEVVFYSPEEFERAYSMTRPQGNTP